MNELKNLEQNNKQKYQNWLESLKTEIPALTQRNGFECPKCFNELIDINSPGGNPLQVTVKCSKCEYKSFRII
jgi:predicted RNA-binding Zn-ribbon protein involved in translation (DUF1610 family)